MNLKGTLPTLILQVLDDGPLHGYQIAKEIKQRSKGVLEFREGTLYPALHAHEGNGLLVSSVHTENGRQRRYYKLTQAGHDELAKAREEWKQVSGAVSLILEGA